jgi:hypothetical protein
MRFAVLIAPLASLVLLGACATDPESTTVAAGPKVICTTEAPTGSNIKVRRCWTEEQWAQEQQDARGLTTAPRTMSKPEKR